MPDESNRIRESQISAMNNVLFLLNSFDPKTDPKKHPRIMVLFNDVSKFELFDSNKEDTSSIIRALMAQRFQKQKSKHQERIETLLKLLKNHVTAFYLQDNISDKTVFGKKTWESLKEDVCNNEDYLGEIWYK